MTNAGPVLSLLREKTGEIHWRLESRMDAINRLSDPASRNALVQRYHQFHAATEAAMTSGLPLGDAGDWRRTPLIENCLALLGLSPLPVRALQTMDRDQALGALYVLEGSALGGKVILKELERRGADRRGLTFLDPHGDTIAARWRAVVALIEGRAVRPERVADGATIAFAQACETLCLEGADA